ncbi:DegT/DnrJ/EryC1/StrS family aminotransferase [Streptomyces kaniharaensis]|uniref:DegT/DnrJ/EryC1/StrS family aminotransferase n=1 Tax=Streptomyces kaniharaensis TaxID=212423 RepID=A0A6N7KJR0_9ACTN|nr:DegT/DnrJ/EryC1/StrS family aminotransferase [Streptomyces kaniharaensis]MQS11762.1 DegT/DnrJ/EryC1/StrS family aminotransferase [Streptomyces kaniharaensis]
MNSTIPEYRRNATPFLYGQETAAVARVLEAGQYGHTEVTEEFEQKVAAFLGVREAVAVTSGTAAMHTALLAAGIGPGHKVIVPSLTFCATIQAILACGATPRFIEVNPDTLCIEPDAVAEAITPATRAVMPVLFGGRAIDLSSIRSTLDEQGIAVIEDAAHAFGSHSGPARVGNTGDLTCFSFGPVKNLTCGQGGMVIPRTPEEAATVRRLRLLGVVTSQAARQAATSYRVEGFGLRYQLSSINAAIGLTQLPRFKSTEVSRQELWRAYRAELHHTVGVTLVDVDVDHTVPHLCVVRVANREAVFRQMLAAGIAVGVHYPPNHLQPAFAQWRRSLPVTEQIGKEILSLPFHQHMTEDDVRHVASALKRAIGSGR